MLATSPGFQRAVGHSAYSAVGTVSFVLVNFLFAGLTIRFLGNEQAGYLILLTAVLSLTQAAGGISLTIPATRRAAGQYAMGNHVAVRRLVGSVMLVNGAAGLAAALACIALFPALFRWSRLPDALAADAYFATILMAGSFLADQFGTALRLVYAACLRQDLKNYTLAGMGIGGGVAKIVWLAHYPTMPACGAASLTVSAAWLVVDAHLVGRLLRGAVWPGWCPAEIKALLKFSLWEVGNGVSIAVGNAVDRFILTTYLGTGSLPVYAFAQRFFQQTHTALVQQFSFVFPLMAATGDQVYGRIGAIHDRARWFLAATGALAYAAVFLAGPTLADYIVGAEFAERARWPVYLASVQGLAFSFVIANYFLHYAVGNGAANALFSAGNYAVVIILGFILIPRHDYIGASLAQTAVLLSLVVYLAASKRILRIEGSWAGYWSAYVSPIAVFFISILIGKLTEYALGSSLIAIAVGLLAGCLSGTAALVALEVLIFPSFRRLAMIAAAWELIRKRLRRSEPDPQRSLQRTIPHG